MSSRLHLWITSTSQLHGSVRYSLGMIFLLKKMCHTASRHFVVVMAALRMFPDLFFFKKTKPSEWEECLEEYYAWRKRTYSATADREKRWIEFFFKYTGCKQLSQPSISDVLKTCQYVETHYKTKYSRSQFLRSNGNFFAYFHSRGYPCLSRKSFSKVIHRVK